MKHKIHWIGAELYPVLVGCCFNEDAFWREVRHAVAPTDLRSMLKPWANPRGATSWLLPHKWGPAKQSAVVITLDAAVVKDFWVSSVGAMLAHEAVHAKNFIEQCIGEEKMSDEAEAYLVQWITRQATHTLIKYYRPKFVKE